MQDYIQNSDCEDGHGSDIRKTPVRSTEAKVPINTCRQTTIRNYVLDEENSPSKEMSQKVTLLQQRLNLELSCNHHEAEKSKDRIKLT